MNCVRLSDESDMSIFFTNPIDREISPLKDENTPIRIHTTVTSSRVNYYSDVVASMMDSATRKFIEKYKREPNQRELRACEREAIRAIHFDRNLDKASKLEMKPLEFLKG